MPTSLTIPKNPVYPRSMDWTLLRREGIRHIENLGSAIWTDFNLHDPGITLLEILCYALTDLGYRTNLPAKDLFAGSGEKDFYTAKTILPCAPVTAIDLRKLLVDLPGVRNAWVEQNKEPEVRFKLDIRYFETPAKLGEDFSGLLNSWYQSIVEEKIQLNFPDRKLTDPSQLRELLQKLIHCRCNNSKADDAGNGKRDLYRFLGRFDTPEVPLMIAIYLYNLEYRFSAVSHFFEKETAINPDNKDKGVSSDDLSALRKKLLALRSLELESATHRNESRKAKTAEKITELRSSIKTTAKEQFLNWALKHYNADAIESFFFADPILSYLLEHSLTTESYEENSPDKFNLFLPQGIYSVTIELEEAAEINEYEIKQAALNRLHRYRNLGEDFHPDIQVAEKKKISVELLLELLPSADEEAILAEIVEAIRNYLSTPVRFYSLEEMLNKNGVFYLDSESIVGLTEALIPDETLTALKTMEGRPYEGLDSFRTALEELIPDVDVMEELYPIIFVNTRKLYDADPVYMGPILDHGFIDEQELLATQPRQTVYKSDMYKMAAETPGVRQVNSFRIFYSEDKEKDDKKNQWCLPFDCRCLPELNLERSTFTVNKGGGDIEIPTSVIEDYAETHPQPTTKINRESSLDLPTPSGILHQDLTDYTSIQEEFPRTYKIGRTGIASNETALRKAQAKQLKGYLFFYDQLLANYLAQLAQVREAFSLTQGATKPYQPLYEIPGIKDILLDFQEGEDWQSFIADPDNPYERNLAAISTGGPVKSSLRRNKILDHLLARFGEEFTDYVLDLYQIASPATEKTLLKGSLKDWATDKKRYLDYIPVLGWGRSLGFNYRNPDQCPLWCSDPFSTITKEAFREHIHLVEGIKRRVCAKLGIDDWTRHTITCEPAFSIEVGPVRDPGSAKSGKSKYGFYVKADENTQARLLVSTARFSTIEAAEQASADFLNAATDKNNYGIFDDSVIGFWIGIAENDRTQENAVMLEPRPRPEGISQRLENLRNLASANCQDDSFHILEHILLRPRDETYTKTLRPLVSCPDCLELLDPYSFWVSIVVPDWVDRFREPVQFQLFKQTVRREAPAHLAIRFCILDREKMLAFEQAYYSWLKALCDPKQTNLSEAADDLTGLMLGWNETNTDY